MKIDTHTPHVEPAWVEAFLLELRLRGVDGRRIGAALAEVEAHCAESGESAQESFGDPTAYAVELAPVDGVVRDWRVELIPSGAGLTGMLLTLGALGALRTDTRVQITTGVVAMVVLTVLGVGLVARHAARLLRAVVRHWWVSVLGAVAPGGLFVSILLLADQTLVTLSPSGTLLMGVLLLAGSTAMALRVAGPGDPVVGPEEAGGAGTIADGAFDRALERLTPWLLPILTAVMALPLLLL